MTGKKRELQPWEIISNQDIYISEPWIKLSVQKVRLPNGKVISEFHRVAMPEYAVIVATTTDGRIIMERQYKHGVGKVSLMLPGGLIEVGEESLAAAKRELLEETGYAAEDWQFLGCFVANANYGCGKAHIFTAKNAVRVKEPNSGDLEDIGIVLMQPADVIDAMRNQEVVVLSTVASIALATNAQFTIR